MKKLLLALTLPVAPAGLLAQQTQHEAQDSLNHIYTHIIALKPRHFYLKHTPFDKVEVLDNRADTTRFFTYDSAHVPVGIRFDRPAALAISEYYTKVMATLDKGNRTLLLNIKQLGATNVPMVPRRAGKHDGTYLSYPRKNLHCVADAWVLIGEGRYRKIGSLDYSTLLGTLSDSMAEVLNSLLAAAGLIDGNRVSHPSRWTDRLQAKHDSARFSYAKDTTGVTLPGINQPATARWQIDYSVVKDPPLAKGHFKNFDDFRDGHLSPDTLKLWYDSRDSLYKLSPAYVRKHGEDYSWALADSGHFYLNLGGNRYLELMPRDGKRYFYVPHSLPTMHGLMTIAWADQDQGGAHGGGNILVLLGAAVVSGLAREAESRAVAKKARAAAEDPRFRTCFIDMDSGDIVY